MRILRLFALAAVAIACSLAFPACATQSVVNMAQGNPAGASRTQPNYQSAPPNPAFYALVPLTLPFDLVTLPFQFIFVNSQGGQFTATPVAQPQQQSSQPPQNYGPQPPPNYAPGQ
jgi:hypothetical protein